MNCSSNHLTHSSCFATVQSSIPQGAVLLSSNCQMWDYTSGQFAKKANVTLRTIRFYDKKDILKPSFRNNNGNRYYTDEDLVKLQQILLLKYLGFSLDEIREITLGSGDWHILQESLSIQKKLVQERIGELQSVLNAIDNTSAAIEKDQDINWNHMMDLIHLTAIERSLKSQYLNASNISARIRLHRDYSVNPEGWFHFELKEGMCVLKVVSGSGSLWIDKLNQMFISLCLNKIKLITDCAY